MAKPFQQSIYEFEDFCVDRSSSMLYKSGAEIALPPKAIKTLLAFVEQSGKIISKEELMTTIWQDSIVEESNLSLYLHLLRKALGKTRSGRPFIETLKGRGYRFNGEVMPQINGSTPHSISEAESAKTAIADARLETSATNHRSTHRVERHGNVLAIADWHPIGTDNFPVDKIVKQEALDKHAVPQKSLKRHGAYFAVAILAFLLIGAVSAAWIRSVSDTDGPSIKRDLTFLNLTNGEDIEYATISPNGAYFVYASTGGGQTHLWLQQTGQAARREVIPPFSGTIHGTAFTPDSQFIYFFANENGGEINTLYRVPALGGVHVKLMSDVAITVSFSPDGSEMVFGRWDRAANRSSLVIASADGKQERVLLTRTGNDAISSVSPAWSPDGNMIAFGSFKTDEREGSYSIEGIDPNTGETQTISTERWDNCFRMAWTRDGLGIVFIGTRAKESSSTRRDQLYYLELASGGSRRLTTDGSRHQYASLGVTDNNEILAVPFDRSSQIWAMDASGDSRTAAQITTGFADGRSGIAPFADGRVSYLARNGDGFSVWVMNADGSDRRQLTVDPPEIEELRAAQDGSFFVFAARTGGWSHLNRVDANGSDLKQLTFGDRQEIDSTVSPDGDWIIYNSSTYAGNYGSSALWKMPSEGGNAIQLSNTECTAPQFSPDGKSVSCVVTADGSLRSVDVENGSERSSYQAVSNAVLNIGSRWMPDGTGLTYIVQDRNVGNIWIQPARGGQPRPLTDFTSGEIYNYAFSHDGSRLFVARGYSRRNAVLVSNFRGSARPDNRR